MQQRDARPTLERERYLGRVEAFSDGVFRAGLTSPDLTPRERRSLTRAWAAGPVLYGICLRSHSSIRDLSIAGFALIAIPYLLPTPRLLVLARRTQDRRRGYER